MHLLYIDQYYHTEKDSGRVRSYALARHLVEQGHQVTLIAPYLNSFTGEVPERCRGRLICREKQDGIQVIRTYSYPDFMRNARVRLLNHLSFTMTSVLGSFSTDPCNVVYATSPPPTVGLAGYVASRFKRAPFIFEVRDLWPEGPIASSKLGVYNVGIPIKPLTFGVAKRLVRFLYRQAARIVILTPAFREPIVAQGGRDSDIVMIPHGIDPRSVCFRADERARIREQYDAQDRFVVTYAGTFGFNQRLDFVLDVADHLRAHSDIVFWLIGDGPTKDDLMEAARRRALENITFFEPQSYSHMPAFLSASDLGLIVLSGTPVHRTVWPNKLVHYMACSRPVLINFDGLTRQLLEEAGAGVFVPRDPRAMAERILQLSRDPEALVRMGQNARSCVVQRFDRGRMCRAFEGLLLQVVHEPHDPAG